MVFDPGVYRVPQLQPDWGDLIARQLALLMQLDSGATGVIKAPHPNRTRRSGLGCATAATGEIAYQFAIHRAEAARARKTADQYSLRGVDRRGINTLSLLCRSPTRHMQLDEAPRRLRGDVGVHAEQVRRVVLRLELRQSRVVAAERATDFVGVAVSNTVDVHPASRERS